MTRKKYISEKEVNLNNPRKTVYNEIFYKHYEGTLNTIPFSDFPKDLKPTDLINVEKAEPWDLQLTITRPRLETDKEQKKRHEESQGYMNHFRELRYETYLNLKKEFEDTSIPSFPVDKNGLMPCPNCGCTDLKDAYVYIKCNKCLMEGPKSNDGHNDDHADHMDHKWAIEEWNNLPRKR